MFESVVVSTKKRGQHKQWLTLPLALLAHAVVFAGLIVASFLTVESVPPPPVTISFVAAPPPPPPPPPPPRRQKSADVVKPVVEPVKPAEIVQPTAVPQETPTPGTAGGDEEDEGEDWGVDGGVEGGVEGGVIGGVLGGVVGGVQGGLLSAEPLLAGVAGVTTPELIASTRVQPKYPELARQARVSGQIILQIVVRMDGSVGDIQVLKSPGERFGFDESAIDAVRQWRYNPGLQSGRPVDVYLTVVVDFTLR